MPLGQRPEVFISDGHWRKTLAAVRGLGREGVKMAVGESTRLFMSSFSRYCNRALVYPSPQEYPSDFVGFLRDALKKGSYRMMLPMEDETISLVSEHASELSHWTYLPVVPIEKLRFAQSKDEVMKLARKIGVPTPRTIHVTAISQLRKARDSLTFPAVIKPVVSSGAVGIVYVREKAKLEENYLKVHEKFPFPLIQEYVPGDGNGYGASFLFDESGHVRASFIHRRIREFPVSGGASTLRVSARRDDIRDMAEALLKAIGWFGVAMVEFRVDPRDGVPKLMEINPRFWGSLALAIRSGVNFPYLLYRMARGERFKPVTEYRVGTKCRWLLPGDILHFIHNPRRMQANPSFFKFWNRNTGYDILSWRDPLPALGKLMTLLTLLYDKDMKRRLKERKQPS